MVLQNFSNYPNVHSRYFEFRWIWYTQNRRKKNSVLYIIFCSSITFYHLRVCQIHKPEIGFGLILNVRIHINVMGNAAILHCTISYFVLLLYCQFLFKFCHRSGSYFEIIFFSFFSVTKTLEIRNLHNNFSPTILWVDLLNLH